MNTMFMLHLVGSPVNSGGDVTFEVASVSFSKDTLDALALVKNKELEEDLEGDDGEYVLHNTDLSDRPSWIVSEVLVVP